MNFKQCRTCLCESEQNKLLEDTISVFDVNMKIAELVMACASVEIINEDPLPNIICTLCVDYASTSYKFKRKCEESEQKLKLTCFKSEFIEANVTCSVLQTAEIISETQNEILEDGVTDEEITTPDQFDSDDDKPLILLKSHTEQCPSLRKTKNIVDVSQRSSCSKCKKKFSSVIIMRKHILKCMRKHKNDCENYFSGQKGKCLVCLLEFETQLQLKKHYTTHDRISCPNCGKIFKNVRHLIFHKNNSCNQLNDTKESGLKFGSLNLLHDHQTENEEIKCLDCGNGFSTFRKLRRHKLQHCKVRFPPQFHCSICKLPFSNPDELAEHRQMHNDRTCEYCGKNVMKEYEQKHLLIHEKNGLECLQCDATFTKLSSYRQHISSYNSNFTCSDCPDTFTNIHDFRSHKQYHFFNELQPEYYSECFECDQTFEDRNSLFQHFLSHTSYRCRACKKRLKTLHELAKHNRTKACEKELSKRTCWVCNRVFNRVAHLRRHLLTHNSNLSTCKFCEFKSERPSALAQHMLSSHDDLRNVQCPDCDKRFFTKFNMHQHRTIHTGQRKHICDYCGKVFALGNYLKEHIRIHTGERAHTCTVCQKQFIQYRSLVSHMDMHLPRQQHICPICGKTYPRKGGMRIHMKRHLNERPFQCSVCNKGFKTKQEMEKHTETHSGVRNYVCSVCGNAFGRKYALNVHMKIHTGETPHECVVCGKRFIQSHSLKGHMKTHHDKGAENMNS